MAVRDQRGLLSMGSNCMATTMIPTGACTNMPPVHRMWSAWNLYGVLKLLHMTTSIYAMHGNTVQAEYTGNTKKVRMENSGYHNTHTTHL